MTRPRQLWTPITVSLLFSGSYIAAKYATYELGPLTTTMLRYLAALVFLVALSARFALARPGQAGKDLALFFIMGLFGIVGYHYFFFSSLKYTAVANTAIINATSPIATAIAAAWFLREKLRRSQYLGIVLAFIGVITLITRGDLGRITQLAFNKGDLLMLCSVLSWVVYAVIVKKLSAKYNGYTLTFYATAFGICILAFPVTSETPIAQVQAMSPIAVISVLYMGIFASALGYLLYNYSIRDLGPTLTSAVVFSLVPIFTTVLAYLFFAEPLLPVMLASMGLIILGIWRLLKPPPTRPAKSE